MICIDLHTHTHQYNPYMRIHADTHYFRVTSLVGAQECPGQVEPSHAHRYTPRWRRPVGSGRSTCCEAAWWHPND